MKLLEICVDSLESAKIAAESGADRIEICQDLSVGGLTPSPEFIHEVKKIVSIPVYVLIRLKSGFKKYSFSEAQKMDSDIRMAVNLGVDGLVFGALHEDFGCIQYSACRYLMDASHGLPVTFHRAFDLISHKSEALEDIISLGFKRILTTGGPETAINGISSLKQLIQQANSRIIIMPGGDVSDKNLNTIVKETNGLEFHSSGRRIVNENTKEKSVVCDRDVIQEMKKILGLYN